MRQARQNATFAQEAGTNVVEIEPTTYQLDRNLLVEICAFTLAPVDDAHTAAANALDHAEWAEHAANQAILRSRAVLIFVWT